MAFYTYFYQRQKDGTPYYIGKGQNGRAFSKKHTVNLPNNARIVIQQWATEQEAFDVERYYINLFGRKDNGTGTLRNRSDGGEGPSGFVRSKEECHKIGERSKGNTYGSANKGRSISAAQAQQHSARLKSNPEVAKRMRELAQQMKGKPWSEARRAAQNNKGKVCL